MKPYKGQISRWKKVACPKDLRSGEKEPNLGYYIAGRPSGHPEFTDWIKTSPVVKQEGNQIETWSSRYELVEPRDSTETA